MIVRFDVDAYHDYESFCKNSPAVARKILELFNDIAAHPDSGIGKPEALRFNWSGWWSRRNY